MQHRLLDRYGGLTCEKHEHFEIELCVGIRAIAFEIESADHFAVYPDRCGHLRSSGRTCNEITRIQFHIRNDNAKAGLYYPTYDADAYLHLEAIIGTIIVQSAAVMGLDAPPLAGPLDDKYLSRVIMNEFARSIDNQIENRIEIE